jgi:hypothetical protein
MTLCCVICQYLCARGHWRFRNNPIILQTALKKRIRYTAGPRLSESSPSERRNSRMTKVALLRCNEYEPDRLKEKIYNCLRELAFIEATTANSSRKTGLRPRSDSLCTGSTRRFVDESRSPRTGPPGDAGFTGDLSVGLPYP